MPDSSREETQDLLRRIAAGDSDAAGTLFAMLGNQLKKRATYQLSRQAPDHTLQPTALINEAYLKLFGGQNPEWTSQRHLLAVASGAMRQVLIDHARGRQAEKRTAPGMRIPLDGLLPAYEAKALDVLALEEALQDLSSFDPEMAEVFEYRFYGGRELPEIALMLDIPVRTLQRKWSTTRAWLLSRIS